MCDRRGFTLIEVQVAIVLFVFGMIAFLGYARVNGQLVASVADQRSVDGYADLAGERAIVVIASKPGTTAAPACDITLEDIDDSGAYPVVEISVSRALP
jgi:Tfp pilus assembly protein PilV